MKTNIAPRNLLVALLELNNTLERRSEGFFQPYGITGAQFNILNLLADEGGSMDQAALVELLLVGKSSVSVVINRMVRNGLIRREEHSKDRRQTVLFLTPEGRARWERIFPTYEAGVNYAFQTLNPADRRVFLQCVEKLSAALEQNGAPTATVEAATPMTTTTH